MEKSFSAAFLFAPRPQRHARAHTHTRTRAPFAPPKTHTHAPPPAGPPPLHSGTDVTESAQQETRSSGRAVGRSSGWRWGGGEGRGGRGRGAAAGEVGGDAARAALSTTLGVAGGSGQGRMTTAAAAHSPGEKAWCWCWRRREGFLGSSCAGIKKQRARTRTYPCALILFLGAPTLHSFALSLQITLASGVAGAGAGGGACCAEDGAASQIASSVGAGRPRMIERVRPVLGRFY